MPDVMREPKILELEDAQLESFLGIGDTEEIPGLTGVSNTDLMHMDEEALGNLFSILGREKR